MAKSKTIEHQVLERYEALGGLVKEGQMVNKDKESRAREYIKSREKIVEEISEGDRILKNSKYGEFIVQTNYVQFYLAKLIFLRSFERTEDFKNKLERLTMGPLIDYLNVCAETKLDIDLANNLKKYKTRRDALAHKMFTAKKLTPKECENAIRLGNKIIEYLEESLKQKNNMIKGTDKISDFPKQYNKLVKQVESLEKRIEKLEKKQKVKKPKKK